VEDLVAEAGGTMRIESAPGQGMRVDVEVPS
jgi:signal transduction histidine kinase